MKKAIFITNPTMDGANYNPCNNLDNRYDWQKNSGGKGVFEGRKVDLPADKGLLTFRRKFECNKEIKRAVIRATALGIFDMTLNRKRVGTVTDKGIVYDELKPEWTDYHFRVFEYEYDVTTYIEKNNIFVAQVSLGWWSDRISFGFYGYKKPAFCGEIEIEYCDGTSEIIATDENFESTVCGPVMFAGIWDGEYYDASKKYDAETVAFEQSEKVDYFTGEIVPHYGPYVRVRTDMSRNPISAVIYDGEKENGSTYGEINIISRKIGKGCEKVKLRAGQHIVLDMGQNMVGRPHLEVSAPLGTKIRFGFAEFLNDSGEESRGNDGPKGSIYIKNYRSALARFTYVAAGDEFEEYSPRFTFFGFRYLEIRSDADIEIHSVVGEVVGSNMPLTCSLETSNAEVNKLISNVIWGAMSNYLSVPTDCPQRDERLGWTGDTQIFCGAGSYLFNINTFMRKWLQDARDSQVNEVYRGCYSQIIPRVWKDSLKKGCGSAAWTDAGVIVPYQLYLMYNDIDIIKEHYASMEDYMESISHNDLKGPDANYGDWLCYEETDKAFLSYSYYAYDASLMALYSEILGKEDRKAYYEDLRKQIVARFLEIYACGEEDLKEKSQTAYLCALHFNLVEGKLRENCIKKLKAKIIENDYTLSTGFVGTGILNQTLSEVGLDELSYSLLLQSKDPSWLYSVKQGATTVWERWNSYTIENGFGDVKMNSFNHYAYGAVLEWMYSKMAGISPDTERPGFEHFILCPRPDTRKGENLPKGQEPITMVKASYNSVRGTIRSEWEYENGEFVYRAEIPEGTSARVEFPLLSGRETVQINYLTMTVEELGAEIKDGKMIFELSEGKYTIR